MVSLLGLKVKRAKPPENGALGRSTPEAEKFGLSDGRCCVQFCTYFPEHFSGPRRVVGLLGVFVCQNIGTITFERSDILP